VLSTKQPGDRLFGRKGNVAPGSHAAANKVVCC